MKLLWSNLSLGGLYTDANDADTNDADNNDNTRWTEHDCTGSLPNEPKTLTPITWSPLMRWVKSFQILRPETRHNQWQNSHPAVHHLQDQDSTPSMWSQDQCLSTAPGIYKCCSPTASTALETCRASTTSRQTQLSLQSNTEGRKFPSSTRRRSKRS